MSNLYSQPTEVAVISGSSQPGGGQPDFQAIVTASPMDLDRRADIATLVASIGSLAGKLRRISDRCARLSDKYESGSPERPGQPDSDMRLAYRAAPDHETGRAASDAVHANWASLMEVWKRDNEEYRTRTGLKYAFRAKCRHYNSLCRKFQTLTEMAPANWPDITVKASAISFLDQNDIYSVFDFNIMETDWLDDFNASVVRDVVRLSHGGACRPSQATSSEVRDVEAGAALENVAA